ncbi:PepSY-associated TM helix domain-containing protein [Myxococcota bacterium]|nr:PepSY-associated TM helix domain-containing protein [Myxococcota bacterium]
MSEREGRSWFRWNRNLHRDVGYAVSVLTALYAVSGLAVNHIDDWNPNYAISTSTVALGPVPTADLDAAEARIVAGLALDPSEVRGRHFASPTELKVFLEEGGEVVVDPATGQGFMKRVQKRHGLFQANALHLNRLKGAWTYVADAYAVVLFYLAVGGLFMLKGKTGLAGRGKWLVAAGTLVPIAFLLWG